MASSGFNPPAIAPTTRWIIDWNSAGPASAGDLTINGAVFLNQGNTGAHDIFCGNNLTLNGSLTSNNGLTKQGGSTLTLNGTNTYSGATTLYSGTVVVNGRLNSAGTVTVNSGTELTGSGLLTDPVSVVDGGSLVPGVDGSGTITLGGLSLSANAKVYVNLGAPTNTNNGVIQVNGNLTLDGQWNFTDLGGFTNGSYTLLRYTGSVVKNGASLVMPLGYIGAVTITNKEVHLQAMRAQALSPRPDEYQSYTNSLALDWASVAGVTAYRVYLGVNSNSVATATTNTVGIYLGQTTSVSFPVANLAGNTNQYWRVDYVLSDGTVFIGPVWSFFLVNDQDLYLDTWVATDALGRSLPTSDIAGPPRPNRPIGIFYFLWHSKGGLGTGPRDNTATIAALNNGTGYADPHNPWADNPPWQTNPSEGVSWYWGQPEAGYYANDDEWVIRRHIALLQAAGIEVLGFDSTNGHPESQAPYFTKIADVIRKMRREGFRVNLKFMFYTHGGSGGSPGTVTWLYDNFYKPGLYPELWFYWQGKPLIIGYPDGLGGSDVPVSDDVRNFFTWRSGWANGSNPVNEWQWIDTPTPQNHGYDSSRPDLPEQMPVACGGWAGAANPTARSLPTISFTSPSAEPKGRGSSSPNRWPTVSNTIPNSSSSLAGTNGGPAPGPPPPLATPTSWATACPLADAILLIITTPNTAATSNR